MTTIYTLLILCFFLSPIFFKFISIKENKIYSIKEQDWLEFEKQSKLLFGSQK